MSAMHHQQYNVTNTESETTGSTKRKARELFVHICICLFLIIFGCMITFCFAISILNNIDIKMTYSGVSICKRSFDQLIIIREYEDINYKTHTIFIFFISIIFRFFSACKNCQKCIYFQRLHPILLKMRLKNHLKNYVFLSSCIKAEDFH